TSVSFASTPLAAGRFNTPSSASEYESAAATGASFTASTWMVADSVAKLNAEFPPPDDTSTPTLPSARPSAASQPLNDIADEPKKSVFGRNRIRFCPAPSASRRTADVTDTAGNAVHVVPPFRENCQSPLTPLSPVTATPDRNKPSASEYSPSVATSASTVV